MTTTEFKEFIQNSSLSDDNKAFWGKAIGCMNDEECGIAARFVEGDLRRLMFYTDTLRRKYESVRDNNAEAMNEIVVCDKEFVNAI